MLNSPHVANGTKAMTQPPWIAASTTTGKIPSDSQKGIALPSRATCAAGMTGMFML
jgi:hypothetical protein